MTVLGGTRADVRAVPDVKAAHNRPVEPAGVSRRKVLQGLGVGGATILVAGSGAASYRVFDSRVLDPGEGSAYSAWSHWREPGTIGMVGAAVLAANAHNAQAWRFVTTEDTVDLFADTGRGTGAVDPFHREMYVGLGCAVENLMLGAQARGLTADLTLLPGRDPTHVAHLGLAPGGSTLESALHRAIGTRHSNRGPYTSRAVPPEVVTALGGQATGLNGVSLHWFTSTSEVAAVGAAMVDAAGAINADEEQSRDAFAWFRSSADAIEKHKDGLTLDGQGLNAVTTALGKLLPASSRSSGDKFWLDQTRLVHTKTAAAYGVIVAPSVTSPLHRLTAGRLLQRIHLDITNRGMALQHMNQITERIDREAGLGLTPTFGPRLAELLDTQDGQAMATFRIGYPVRTPRRSPRRPVSELGQL